MIGPYSKQRLTKTFLEYDVQQYYANPIFNYLIHGLPPGNFFAALIANDAHQAIQSSHPSNQIQDLKNLINWMHNYLPPESRGSWEAVNNWQKLDSRTRKQILEECDLIYTDREEAFKALSGETVQTKHSGFIYQT